ncbi:MAG: hypothetical protein V7749_00395 [Cocleimonas sp.]|jgi:hypothetical protein
MYNANSIYSTEHFNQSSHEPQNTCCPPQDNNKAQQDTYTDFNKERYSGAFKEYASLKCHGKKAAIELKPSLTRKLEWETVMIEAATAVGPKQFNWADKISIQITKSELPHVISTLLGIKQRFEGKSHGVKANKGFSLTWQSKGESSMMLFVCVSEGGKPAMAVPVAGFDAMMMGHMACVQYVRNFPGLTTDACIKSLETMARHNI